MIKLVTLSVEVSVDFAIDKPKNGRRQKVPAKWEPSVPAGCAAAGHGGSALQYVRTVSQR